MLITSTLHTRQRKSFQSSPPAKAENLPQDSVTFGQGDDNDLLSGGLAVGAAAIGGTLAYLGTTSSNPLIAVPSAALSIAGAGAVVGGGVGLAHDLGNHSGHEDYTKKGLIIGGAIGAGVGTAIACFTNSPILGVATAIAGGGTAALGAWIGSQSN
jgi:hypothetical protein